MKNNSIARILMSAAPIMIVGCLLASGAPCQGSVGGRWLSQRPPRGLAPSAHGPRLSDRRSAADLPGLGHLRQRGYANPDYRRPVPLAKHSLPGGLAAHGPPHLQRGVRGLRF